MNEEYLLQLAELLRQTFTVAATPERAQAETQLGLLATRPEEYYRGLLLIIATHSQFDSQVQHAAAISLRKLLKEKTEEINVLARCQMAVDMLEVLTQPPVPLSVKAAVGFALLAVIDFEQEPSQVVQALVPPVLKAFQQGSNGVVGACKAVRAVCGGSAFNSSVQAFWQQVSGPLFSLVRETLQAVSGAADDENVEVLYEECATLCAFTEYYQAHEADNLLALVQAHGFEEVCGLLLTAAIADPSLTERSLICVGIDQVYSRFNQAKKEVFKVINTLLMQYYAETEAVTDPPFHSWLFSSAEQLLASLGLIVGLPDFEEIMQTEYVFELVIEVFNLLEVLVKDSRYAIFFNRSFKENELIP